MVLQKYPEPQPQMSWAAPILHPSAYQPKTWGPMWLLGGLQTCPWVGSEVSLSSKATWPQCQLALPKGSLG